MQTVLKIPMYTAIFTILMIAVVPRKEIRRLAIYGIIFGAINDVIALSFGQLFGVFEYIDFAPLGYWFLPFFAPIAWTVFYMLYFYFLPEQKLLMYAYVASAIGYSVLFTQLLFNTNIMALYPPDFIPYNYMRIIIPLIVFLVWFPFSTWGYLRLTGYFERQEKNQRT
jgi:hypothetical protein